MVPSRVKVYKDTVYIVVGGRLKKVVNGKLYAVVGTDIWKDDGNQLKYSKVLHPASVTVTKNSIVYLDGDIKKMDKKSTILKTLISQAPFTTVEANSKEEFYASSGSEISHYSSTGQLISTNGKNCSKFSGDGLIATSAYVNNPKEMFFRNGNLYYIDAGYHTLRKLNMQTYYDEANQQYFILYSTNCTVVDQSGTTYNHQDQTFCTLMQPIKENGNLKFYFFDQQNSHIFKVSCATIEFTSVSITNLEQFVVFNESTIFFTKSNDAAIYKLLPRGWVDVFPNSWP